MKKFLLFFLIIILIGTLYLFSKKPSLDRDWTLETARGLFVDLAKTTEKLETEPKFYNTVTSNCTNVLADASNRVNPGSIPWTWARIFTGYADNKLYDLELIPHNKPFEQIYEEARIDGKIKEITKDNENISKEDFWFRLKSKVK